MGALRWSSAFLFIFMQFACGEVARHTGQSCDEPSDCFYPAVCCTDPTTPAYDAPIPLCEEITSCSGYMPPLVEGNPCRRVQSVSDAIQECSEPWICCGQNLTCMTEAACAEVPAPPQVATVSGATCIGDAECPEGELCFDISLRDREGTCGAYAGGPTLPASLPPPDPF